MTHDRLTRKLINLYDSEFSAHSTVITDNSVVSARDIQTGKTFEIFDVIFHDGKPEILIDSQPTD